jgi:long-chain acyl-CoA synthetase
MSNLVEALRAVTDSDPCRPAVRMGASELSYSDLYAASARLGHRLQTGGVEPGDRVALVLANTPGYAIAHYATLTAGGIVVPLNPARTGTALAARLHNARARVALVEHDPAAGIREAAEAAGVELVELTDPAGGSRQIEPHPSTDEEPAMIAYRSSDDEQPIGVVLSHRALAWSAVTASEVLGLTGADTLGSHFPLFYPLGHTFGLGASVAAGCTLVVPPVGEPSPVFPTADRVTVIGTFPILAGHALGPEAVGPRDTSSIRAVFCSGGRNLTPRVRERLASSLGCEVLEGYGPPETAALGCAGRSGTPQAPGSMGPAVPGVDLAIVDGRGRAVRKRRAGRLLARGPNVMSEYWDRPKATTRAFDSGWLITGDRARKDSEGNLYLLDGLWTDSLRGRETGRRGLFGNRS